VIFWNKAAEEVYGWSESEMLGRNILDVTPTADSAGEAAEILDRLRAGQSWSGNFSVRHKDGHWFTVHVTDHPVRDDLGQLEAILGLSSRVSATTSSPSFLEWALPLFRSSPKTWDSETKNRAPPLKRSFLGNLGFAVLLFGAALGARALLDRLMPGQFPYITFFPAVLIASAFLGVWPSLLVLFASAAAGAFWHVGTVEVRAIGASLFLLVGGSVVGVVSHLVGLHTELKRRDRERALVNRELQHRLKNMFAVTSAICLQTLRNNGAPDSLSDAILGRIRAVATSLDLLGVGLGQRAELGDLVRKVVAPIAPMSSRLHVIGSELFIPEQSTTPFALILYELATNSLKHGAWALDQGDVRIAWVVQDNQLTFDWTESRPEPISPAVRQGVGSLLIRRGLPEAKVTQDFRPSGLVCRIVLALP
jgi:PAS domain S-box-containing protein